MVVAMEALTLIYDLKSILERPSGISGNYECKNTLSKIITKAELCSFKTMKEA